MDIEREGLVRRLCNELSEAITAADAGRAKKVRLSWGGDAGTEQERVAKIRLLKIAEAMGAIEQQVARGVTTKYLEKKSPLFNGTLLRELEGVAAAPDYAMDRAAAGNALQVLTRLRDRIGQWSDGETPGLITPVAFNLQKSAERKQAFFFTALPLADAQPSVQPREDIALGLSFAYTVLMQYHLGGNGESISGTCEVKGKKLAGIFVEPQMFYRFLDAERTVMVQPDTDVPPPEYLRRLRQKPQGKPLAQGLLDRALKTVEEIIAGSQHGHMHTHLRSNLAVTGPVQEHAMAAGRLILLAAAYDQMFKQAGGDRRVREAVTGSDEQYEAFMEPRCTWNKKGGFAEIHFDTPPDWRKIREILKMFKAEVKGISTTIAAEYPGETPAGEKHAYVISNLRSEPALLLESRIMDELRYGHFGKRGCGIAWRDDDPSQGGILILEEQFLRSLGNLEFSPGRERR